MWNAHAFVRVYGCVHVYFLHICRRRSKESGHSKIWCFCSNTAIEMGKNEWYWLGKPEVNSAGSPKTVLAGGDLLSPGAPNDRQFTFRSPKKTVCKE